MINWVTHPWNLITGTARHFQPYTQCVAEVENAISLHDKENFARAIHRLQDCFTHSLKGYRYFYGYENGVEIWDIGHGLEFYDGWPISLDGSCYDYLPIWLNNFLWNYAIHLLRVITMRGAKRKFTPEFGWVNG